jgi:quercetin dioxygenase-like cupin family protein
VGGKTPPHSHPFEEGFFLLSGRLNFTAGDESFELDEGDFINIGANVAHAVHNLSGAPAETLIICAPSGFDEFQTEGGYPLDGPDGELVPVSEAVIAKMLQAAEKHAIEIDPPSEAFHKKGRATVVRKGEGLVIDTVGDRYRFLARSEDTGGKYSIWEAVLEPGGGPPPHIHSQEEEGFYVLGGVLSFYTPEGSFQAGPGDFVHLPRQSKHWFRNDTDKQVRALILVAPGGLEKMFGETGTVKKSFTEPMTPPDPEEKKKLLTVAPRFGVTIELPHHL